MGYFLIYVHVNVLLRKTQNEIKLGSYCYCESLNCRVMKLCVNQSHKDFHQPLN